MTAAPDLELAAALARRLCHDLAAALQPSFLGHELLANPSAAVTPSEALDLVATGLAGVRFQLDFARVAVSGAVTPDGAVLARLAEGLFEGGRARLDWQVGENMPPQAGPLLLNLAVLARSALGAGGVAVLEAGSEAGRRLLTARAVDPRANLRPEVTAGLSGASEPPGLSAHWAPAALLRAQALALGGEAGCAETAGEIRFWASLAG
jgi:histidine phosphotransferase ChpT